METIEEMNSSFDDAHKVSFRNKSIYKSNALKQLRWLLWRNMMAIIREPFSFQVQIIQAIVSSYNFLEVISLVNLDHIENSAFSIGIE